MEVGDQRKARGDIKRFGNSHRGARPHQLLVGRRMSGEPRDHRPGEEAGTNRPAAREAVREVAANRAHRRVDPLKLPEH